MPKQKVIKTNKTANFYFITLFVIVSVTMLVVNDFGLLKLIKLKDRYQTLENSLTTLLLQQKKLKEEIIQLQTDKQYIEKIAREKFMMVLPGEKVYRVQEIKKY